MNDDVEVTIRPAIPDDAAELLRFFKEEVIPCDFLETDEFTADVPERLLASELGDIYESTTNLLLLALAGQQIIGYLRIESPASYQRGHVGELGIIVAQDYRRQGLGSILMSEALDWVATESKLIRIELFVQKRNLAAQKMYQQFNFKPEGELPKSFRSATGELLTTILMSRLVDHD